MISSCICGIFWSKQQAIRTICLKWRRWEKQSSPTRVCEVAMDSKYLTISLLHVCMYIKPLNFKTKTTDSTSVLITRGWRLMFCLLSTKAVGKTFYLAVISALLTSLQWYHSCTIVTWYIFRLVSFSNSTTYKEFRESFKLCPVERWQCVLFD